MNPKHTEMKTFYAQGNYDELTIENYICDGLNVWKKLIKLE